MGGVMLVVGRDDGREEGKVVKFAMVGWLGRRSADCWKTHPIITFQHTQVNIYDEFVLSSAQCITEYRYIKI